MPLWRSMGVCSVQTLQAHPPPSVPCCLNLPWWVMSILKNIFFRKCQKSVVNILTVLDVICVGLLVSWLLVDKYMICGFVAVCELVTCGQPWQCSQLWGRFLLYPWKPRPRHYGLQKHQTTPPPKHPPHRYTRRNRVLRHHQNHQQS